jgi:hypothetical protein
LKGSRGHSEVYSISSHLLEKAQPCPTAALQVLEHWVQKAFLTLCLGIIKEGKQVNEGSMNILKINFVAVDEENSLSYNYGEPLNP